MLTGQQQERLDLINMAMRRDQEDERVSALLGMRMAALSGAVAASIVWAIVLWMI